MGTNLQKIYCCPCADGTDILADEDTSNKTLEIQGKVSENSVAMSLPGLTQELARIEKLPAQQAAGEYVKLAWSLQRSTYTNPMELNAVAKALAAHNSEFSLEQLDLNVRELLSTFWNVPSIEGTARDVRSGFTDPAIRAELSELVGAPPFEIISWTKLKELGRIPRSSDGHQVTLRAALRGMLDPGEPLLDKKGNPRMQIYMLSHTWFSRGHLPDGTYDASRAHPDRDDGIKIRSLVAFGEYTRKELGREVWFWIDHLSINQDNIQPGIRSLPLYVTSCSSLLVLVSEKYETRAWTLLEQCLFTAISTKPALTAISCDNSFFSTMRTDEHGKETRKVLQDPLTGVLSDESDRQTIAHLVETSRELWATGWIEGPTYWNGTEPTLNSKGVAKFGPGLRGMDKIEWGQTEVMVRRLELDNDGNITTNVSSLTGGETTSFEASRLSTPPAH